MSLPATTLSILTFIGLAVGFASGLVSLVTKTSTEVEGKKKLTPAGRWALAISIFGFTGSFNSELLKAYIKAQDDIQSRLLKTQEAQWKAHVAELQEKIFENTGSSLKKTEQGLSTTIAGFEAEQQNILKTKIDLLGDNLVRETRLYGRLSSANSPLTSLTVKMVFNSVPQRLLAAMRKGIAAANGGTSEPWYHDLDEHHNVDDSDDRNLRESIYYQQVTLPFINWLGNGLLERSADNANGAIIWKGADTTEQAEDAIRHQGLLVISLGHRNSAVLCIGWLDKPGIFTMDEPAGNEGRPTSLLPSGVLIGEEIDYHLNGRVGYPYKRKYSTMPEVYFEVTGSSVTLAIELGQLSINDALLRYAANGITTAAMPDEVAVFSWRPFKDTGASFDDPPLQLPFDTQQISENIIRRSGFSNHFNTLIPASQRHFSLHVIPNGVGLVGKSYELSIASDIELMEGVRADEPRGYIKIWKGTVRH